MSKTPDQVPEDPHIVARKQRTHSRAVLRRDPGNQVRVRVRIRHLEADYGLNVSSLGSPIGKVKLLDVDDKTHNRFVPFKKYLEKDVKLA